MNKVQLRQQLLASRQCSHSINTVVNAALYEIIQQYQPKCIAAYIPMRQEVNIWSTIEVCKNLGIIVALPCIVKKDTPLIFKKWEANIPLITGIYSTVEPCLAASIIDLSNIDLIILPCVGLFYVKSSIYRLGYGGGFYDRTLAEYKNLNKPLKIGVYHDTMQNIIRLNDEEKSISLFTYDIPLNIAITANGVITTSN